ncbi:MAG: hypothetical protein ABEK01_01555 [Candidatus Nanohaloarchaea archaeon]
MDRRFTSTTTPRSVRQTGVEMFTSAGRIGVPRKGRNAGVALREELPEGYDADYILDLLNGRGKKAAKTGEGIDEVRDEVRNYDFIEMEDTGRPYERPVFTSLRTGDTVIEARDPDRSYDRFYSGLDEIVEENYAPEQVDGDLEALAEEATDADIQEVYGDEVKWGALAPDLDAEYGEVLVPEQFSSLGEGLAQEYWEDPDIGYFPSDASEEEYLAENDTAGVYMFVSGGTAEDAGLEYEQIDGAVSRLGRFEEVEA